MSTPSATWRPQRPRSVRPSVLSLMLCYAPPNQSMMSHLTPPMSPRGLLQVPPACLASPTYITNFPIAHPACHADQPPRNLAQTCHQLPVHTYVTKVVCCVRNAPPVQELIRKCWVAGTGSGGGVSHNSDIGGSHKSDDGGQAPAPPAVPQGVSARALEAARASLSVQVLLTGRFPVCV